LARGTKLISNLFDKELKTCDCKNMDIKKKSIAVKLSKTKSKNGYFLVRMKDGKFAWLTKEVLNAIEKKKDYKPHWQLDCIV